MKSVNKIIIGALASLVIAVGLSACDLVSVNENPNSPEAVPENLHLSGLLGEFSYQVMANTASRTPVHFTQQLAWNGVPTTYDNYDIDESHANNLWTYWSYAGSMQDARLLNEQAEENGNYAYAAIAKTILAWNLAVVTDLWGDVPYSEAFDPENTSPAYDSQEEVYAAIFDLLNKAIEDYARDSNLAPGSDDLLYGGDMQRWEMTTYTLLARLHMRLTEAPGHSPEQQAEAALDALANGYQSNADDADFQYYSGAGEENPFYQWAIDSKWDTRNQLSAHYVELLQDRDDPRLPIQARPIGAVDGNGLTGATIEDPEYAGHVNGAEGVGTGSISSIGAFYSDADAPLNWLSYAEAKFLEAEATLILDGPAAAQPVFEEAIAASMDKLGVSAEDRDAYIASRPGLEEANALEELIVEKYIANFLKGETWNDWRRTGYPELEPAVNPQTPDGSIPVRFPYPGSELSNNSENVTATGIPVGRDAQVHPVWWDTTDGPITR